MNSLLFSSISYSSAPAVFLHEDCEAGTTPSNWSNGGTPEWNYGTAIEGSFSHRCNASADYSSYDHGDRNEVNYFLAWRASNLTNGPFICRGYASSANGGGQQFSAIVLSNGSIRILNASNATVATSADTLILTNTTYYFWIRCVRGTGANGILSLHYSSDTTKPGSALLESASVNNTFPIQFFNIPCVSSTDIIRDTIVGSTSIIGSNPF